MNILRAEEISKLPDIVPVTYNGNLIMIQHVDKNSETARIYLRNDP
ncbi:MAG TPA: H-type small acid-soluble spore protein, partial [Massilibacterium sp.]|nr:H-type small acid-soluble spore protein [Massilibacterium sp.]